MSKKNELNVTIDTIDAKLEMNVSAKLLGRQLFDQVIKTLNMRESWYFGLSFIDNRNVESWVKMNKRLSEQNFPKKNDIAMSFRAKFYPEDASEELILSSSKNMFYLQVKQQIMSGAYFCPAETCVLLASYVCQVKYGDYDSGKYPKGEIDIGKLLPQRILDQHTLEPAEWESKIFPWYKEHRDMLKEDAMTEYLKIAQDMEMYGITYFEIRNKRNAKLWLGIDALGMNVYEENDKLTPRVGFPWSEIAKVKSEKREFKVRSNDKNGTSFPFLTSSKRVADSILERCLGNYDLYKKRRGEESIEVQQMKAMAADERELFLLQKQKLANERGTREEIEAKLREVEERLLAQKRENEEKERAINEYQEKIRALEEMVEQERRQREELAEMRRQLEENNESLKAASYSSKEEYNKLVAQNEEIKAAMDAKGRSLNDTEGELSRYRSEIEELQRAQTSFAQTQREREEALVAAEARALAAVESERARVAELEAEQERLAELEAETKRQSSIEAENRRLADIAAQKERIAELEEENERLAAISMAPHATNGAVPEVTEETLVPEVTEETLVPMINVEKDRDEEERQTAFEKDKNLQAEMAKLASELGQKKDQSKLEAVDKQYLEIKREGRDKFKTLKQVRQGNTKKRVDTFESIAS